MLACMGFPAAIYAVPGSPRADTSVKEPTLTILLLSATRAETRCIEVISSNPLLAIQLHILGWAGRKTSAAFAGPLVVAGYSLYAKPEAHCSDS